MTDLDEWFARCGDILTDWEGSLDSMDTSKPDPLRMLLGYTESGVAPYDWRPFVPVVSMPGVALDAWI